MRTRTLNLSVTYVFHTERLSTQTTLATRYVMFGYLPSQFRLSVVCLSSVTFIHPTQPIEIFGNVSTPFCDLAIC